MRKRKKMNVGTIVAIGLLVYFAFVLVDQQRMLYDKHKTIQSIQTKIEKEYDTQDELNRQKEILDTDEYIEQVAREKLGMVRPGEKVFVDINK